jgi:hypothetical protein
MGNNPASAGLKPEEITDRLFTVINIANTACYCEQDKTEVYILQSLFRHVAGLLADLIDDIGA